MSEAGIKREVRLAIGGRDDTRLFNNPVGVGWTGTVVEETPTRLVLAYPRRVAFGLHEGSGDCIGWRSVVITPDMVGQRVAVFTSLEIKGPKGRAAPKQKNWAEQVRAAGGFAGFARSVADALRIITGG